MLKNVGTLNREPTMNCSNSEQNDENLLKFVVFIKETIPRGNSTIPLNNRYTYKTA